jgi:2-haloacid dehalogenase
VTEPDRGPTGPPPPRAIVFDVNETLLDLAALDAYFEEVIGAAAARREWFATTVEAAMVTTITGRYESFADLGGACLESMARRLGRWTGPGDRERLVREMTHLPPHPDVADTLAVLRRRGFGIGALTNNPLAVVDAQLRNAGLAALFDEVVSAEEVRRLKPAAEPYHHAAHRMGVGTADMLLVAAHGWDCAGARAAGARAAFVGRPGQAPLPAGAEPDIVVTGLAQLTAVPLG